MNGKEIITEDFASHYTITFNYNTRLLLQSKSNRCSISFCHFLSHCKWLPSAAFYNYSSTPVNQKIIQNDDQNCKYYTHICYCSQNKTINCSNGILGTVHPGQTLQANLCNMCTNDESTVLYAEVHNINLPSSTCRIAHQSQLISVTGNNSNTVNYTIVSSIPDNTRCELFQQHHHF